MRWPRMGALQKCAGCVCWPNPGALPQLVVASVAIIILQKVTFWCAPSICSVKKNGLVKTEIPLGDAMKLKRCFLK